MRAWYQIRNTGTQPIAEIRYRLPYEYRIENLRVETGGEKIGSQSIAGTEAEFSSHLVPPWNVKDRKEIVLTYDFKISGPGIPGFEAGPQFFFLPSGEWYPILDPPAGSLSEGGKPPDKWDLVINIPQGYLVHASGTQRKPDHGESRNKAGPSYRFEQKLDTDFDPFVVAGPYVEQQARSGSETVFVWLAKPLPEASVRGFGERFGEEAAYFRVEFGLKPVTKGQVWIIGCDGVPPGENDPPGRIMLSGTNEHRGFNENCMAFPQGVIGSMTMDNPAAMDFFVAPLKVDPSGLFVPNASMDVQLAETWFPFAVHDSPGGPWYPMSGTPDYMALSFNILKNPSKRGDYVRQLIGRVDADPGAAKETLGSSKNIEIGRIRSELFYLALEDRCGAANVHHALAHIVRALRGKTWGVNDLRSAMEAECGADLAEFFRQWLNRPGIPDDFRTRYTGAPAAKPPKALQ